VDGLVQAWVGEMTSEAVVALCAENDVPCASINTIAGIFADPHIAERQNQIALPHERLGDVFVPAVVPKLSRTPGAVESLGPSLGSSNDEILRGLLGMEEGRMILLRNAGII